MRIGVNTLFLLPNRVGGSETVTREILTELAKKFPFEDLLIFTNKENHETFKQFNRVCLKIPATSRLLRVLVEQLILPVATIRKNVHVLLSLGYTGPLFTSPPQVVMIYDTQLFAHPEDFGLISRVCQRILISKIAKQARAILTGSQFAADQIQSLLNIQREKIFVTPFGVRDVFKPTDAPPRREPPFLLCVSNAYPHKNLSLLVRAFDKICSHIPHQLIIVGQPGRGEPPPHPRVIRHHHVKLEELIKLYQECDAFVFPSLYEGFGLPVLEALACGARVVASRAGAIPEVGGDAVTYFNPTSDEELAQVLLQVLRESLLVRLSWREKGLAHVKSFRWDSCAEKILCVLQMVTEPRK